MADLGQSAPTGGGAGQGLATEPALNKKPDKELLARRSDRELYRQKTKYGIEVVDKHYPLRGYGNYWANAIYIRDDGYLEVYYVHDNWNGTGAEREISITLNEETARKIRDRIMAVKTFRDFRSLYDELLNATYCNDEDGAYICEDDDDDDI
jgi:hypothetical protein